MKAIAFLLSFVCLGFIARAAEADPREFFAFYPEVSAKADGAVPFSYKLALARGKLTGFYGKPAVLTLLEVSELKSGYPEAGTIPYPALFFGFSKEGFKRLREHVAQARPSRLILVIDGRAYDALRPATVRDVINRHVRLQLLIPSALDKDSELKALFNKLRAAKAALKR